MMPSAIRFGALSSVLSMLVLLVCALPVRSAPGLTESELKAVFLLRLPQFVSWPDEQSATVFCVAPNSELSGLLQEIVAAEPKGREVRPLIADQVSTCDVVFASVGERESEQAFEQGVLWVSDRPGFAREGGMVELKRHGARMRLVINLPALESAGLKASSKLLQLSEVVGELSGDV
jgi:hypothetical protein